MVKEYTFLVMLEWTCDRLCWALRALIAAFKAAFSCFLACKRGSEQLLSILRVNSTFLALYQSNMIAEM
jgi:hypothetical protein